MIAFRKLCVLCLIQTLWALPFSACAQQNAGTGSFAPSDDSVRRGYIRSSGPDLPLYIGQEYIPNGRRTKGFPFFQSNEPLPGSLYYNDAHYNKVDIQYDLVLDGVVISNFSGDGRIELVRDKLLNFTMGGHHFVYLCPSKSAIKAGYYDQLYKGGVSAFARYEKKLVFPSNLEDQPRYDDYHYYYVEMGGAYYEVGSKGALLDLFRDKKEELKKYIRGNRINFSRDWEAALVKTTAYYDELKK
ncbi:MAG: hypothetical protein Q8927_10750 [Bacteroidota bacterium]|nr:hypothetical protein [Bacteroidota bacterium]MDP4216671.1 hypothetical protein [Bacteroidota bacterium]MDP4244225.1 hypothetical protein [Bacteroidota bacterium]MDP4253403.1 hypothetical protein [Bacteroidota bacterium]MDP4258885.1 hypothetical protein [Bacteroidota bacterium]